MTAIIRRADYTPPRYFVSKVDIAFVLAPEATRVSTRLEVRRNREVTGGELALDIGPDVKLVSLSVDGATLDAGAYRIENGQILIALAADDATIATEVLIAPARNTELEGLYLSGGIYCTQCEAEGFRCITPFPDRPDVAGLFHVRIEGDKATHPVLIAGGNRLEAGDLPGGRHYAVFEDPYPKPGYLFAIVAGDLDVLEDRFRTMGGRDVALKIFVDRGNVPKAAHAMRALKATMVWDEETYGREYHLDIFNIVAVNDFNAGAMENTGLNIFNSKYALADAAIATDADFGNVESVIAHEYLHNWSGNRVTVRDWFQLSLKEGFTVLREQQFVAAMNSPTIARIHDADLLKRTQFPEDAGPLAHPVRPDAYQEIRNFYTKTIYEKGAEVIRMMAEMLGPEKYRAGTDLYFSRNDGKAVTCDDFVDALQEASGIDLAQFRLWYSQAGTPTVTASWRHDQEAETFTLTLEQAVPPTPGQPVKQPMVIPIALGLVGRDGHDLSLTLEGESQPGPTQRVITLTTPKQMFVFTGVAEAPVPSLLRGFSAPINLKAPLAEAELRFLMAHDSDGFNRVSAARALASQALHAMLEGRQDTLGDGYIAAIGDILRDGTLDPAMAAELASLPEKMIFAQSLPRIDVAAITTLYSAARRELATRLSAEWQSAFTRCQGERPYDISGPEMARRSLKNMALAYLGYGGDAAPAAAQYRDADNMTDRLAALVVLLRAGGPAANTALAAFEARYHGDPLTMDKWFSAQAGIDLPGRLAIVKSLAAHPAFTFKNPNRVSALFRGFTGGLSPSFHQADGEGYVFLRESVETLDRINAQVSSGLVGPLLQWKRYAEPNGSLMREQLDHLSARGDLSRNLREVVDLALA